VGGKVVHGKVNYKEAVMEFRPMTKQELYGFAGCEDFASGKGPEIADVTVGYLDCTVVADGTGIAVLNESKTYFLGFKTEGGIRRTMERLPSTIQSFSTLQTTHGFKRVE